MSQTYSQAVRRGDSLMCSELYFKCSFSHEPVLKPNQTKKTTDCQLIFFHRTPPGLPPSTSPLPLPRPPSWLQWPGPREGGMGNDIWIFFILSRIREMQVFGPEFEWIWGRGVLPRHEGDIRGQGSPIRKGGEGGAVDQVGGPVSGKEM